MIDAERRLLTNALRDPENQQFVLLSDRYSPRNVISLLTDYSEVALTNLSVSGFAVVCHFEVLNTCTTI